MLKVTYFSWLSFVANVVHGGVVVVALATELCKT
jgi:hypothetical protein